MSCSCGTGALGLEGWGRSGLEAVRQGADRNIHETVRRQAEHATGAAFHHHLDVIAKAPGQQLCHHPEAAAAALGFLHQAAAGGAGQGPAGRSDLGLQACVTARCPLLAGAADAVFQLGAHQAQQGRKQARLGGSSGTQEPQGEPCLQGCCR